MFCFFMQIYWKRGTLNMVSNQIPLYAAVICAIPSIALLSVVIFIFRREWITWRKRMYTTSEALSVLIGEKLINESDILLYGTMIYHRYTAESPGGSIR